MSSRPVLALALTAAALLAPAAHAAPAWRTTLAGAPFAAAGTGTVTFEADGPALASSAFVRPGSVTLHPAGGGPLVLRCAGVVRPLARCARLGRSAADVQRWTILRPVRFLYEGTDFRLTVSSSRGFRLLVVGDGRVSLRGAGRWSLGGPATPYLGGARVELR